jgi:uncharacterized protein (DUF2249 family)
MFNKEHEMKYYLFTMILLLSATATSFAQQMPDTAFLPEIDKPSYTRGTGPVVMIDEAHHNFHTMGERYFTFAELMRRDGYTVIGGMEPFFANSLDSVDILVISNALNKRNIEDWSLPTPSAFTPEEISAVRAWVEGGGSLFLIADHMPFPGASHDLAAAFGFEFQNDFAMDRLERGPAVFRRSAGTLKEHVITNGYSYDDRIDSVASFTGQAFQVQISCDTILVLDSGFVGLFPEVAWDFNDSTRTIPVVGWLQGAVASIGQGRIAVFGEAAMFTAQIAHDGNQEYRFGMSQPMAIQNVQFLINLMRWLSRWEK